MYRALCGVVLSLPNAFFGSVVVCVLRDPVIPGSSFLCKRATSPPYIVGPFTLIVVVAL